MRDGAIGVPNGGVSGGDSVQGGSGGGTGGNGDSMPIHWVRVMEGGKGGGRGLAVEMMRVMVMGGKDIGPKGGDKGRKPMKHAGLMNTHHGLEDVLGEDRGMCMMVMITMMMTMVMTMVMKRVRRSWGKGKWVIRAHGRPTLPHGLRLKELSIIGASTVLYTKVRDII